jgi:hypothetical protein
MFVKKDLKRFCRPVLVEDRTSGQLHPVGHPFRHCKYHSVEVKYFMRKTFSSNGKFILAPVPVFGENADTTSP